MTGVAWEVGVLAGLLDAGIDLRDADAIIGTSAGSFVGAAVASGYDMEQLFSEQPEPDEDEVAMAAPSDLWARWATAFETGGSDPVKVGAVSGRSQRLLRSRCRERCDGASSRRGW